MTLPSQDSPNAAAGSAWVPLWLSLAAPVLALLNLAGVQLGPIPVLGAVALIASVVLGIRALRRGAQPRWPSIVALVVAGVYILVFAGFLIWAVIGLIQIMFLPTH